MAKGKCCTITQKMMLSKETTYSQARMNLASILEQVWDERQIMVIKRRNQKNVALIAEDELFSLLECVYLLRSPENAKRLFINYSLPILTKEKKYLLNQEFGGLNLLA